MVNVRKWWSDTNGSKIEIKVKIWEVKMKMVNVKMEILSVVAKWGGSVADASASVFLSICFSFSTLNTWRVFSMAFTAFTSSAFAVTFAVFNSAISFS